MRSIAKSRSARHKLSFKSMLVFALVASLVSPVIAQRTTYFKFIINGASADTMTQGETMAWECDCGLGDTLTAELWLDLNGDHAINAGDKQWMMGPMRFIDGDTSWYQGPADSSATLDGIFYCALSEIFQSFALAPLDYIMKVTNTNDASTAQNWLHIDSHPSPPATISGKISIEGIDPPDPLLNAVWVSNEMEGEEGPSSVWWSAVTNDSGDYTLNLPWSDSTWKFGPMDDIQPYITPAPVETLVSGHVTGIDFLYEKPEAYVWGTVKDDRDSLLPFEVYVRYYNETTEEGGQQQTVNGEYLLGMHPGEIRLGLSEEELYPDYLIPRYGFTIYTGDSLEKNFTCWRTDTSIYGLVTEEGGTPSQAYAFQARHDTYGEAETYSDPTTGEFELRVTSGSKQNDYWVGLNTGETPLPEGFGFETGNGWDVAPGETVYVNLVSYQGSVSGSLYTDASDPEPDYTDYSAVVIQPEEPWQVRGQSQVNSDGTYKVYAPPETLNLQIWGSEEWLVKPCVIENVVVDTVDVPGKDFMLNYGHCQVQGHLYGLVTPLPKWLWINAGGDGGWPDGYQAGDDIGTDTSYSFRICEGNWQMWAPWDWEGGWDTLYTVTPQDTTFTVTEDDSSVTVDFHYTYIGVAEQETAFLTTLYRAQPNPFMATTNISYGIANPGEITLKIYDLTGRLVKTLVNTNQKPGTYTVKWHGTDDNGKLLPSGIYFYRLETNSFTNTKKIILVR